MNEQADIKYYSPSPSDRTAMPLMEGPKLSPTEILKNVPKLK